MIQVETRLRVARRLIVAVIVFVGVMAALTRLPEVGTVASGLLASAALLPKNRMHFEFCSSL